MQGYSTYYSHNAKSIKTRTRLEQGSIPSKEHNLNWILKITLTRLRECWYVVASVDVPG